MAIMGLPNINIIFKETGSSAITRSQRGIVAIVLKDKEELGPHNLSSISEIPEKLSDENKEQLKLAFIGNQTPPKRVLVYVEEVGKEEGAPKFAITSEAFKYLETVRWDYLAVPFIENAFAEELATWIKSLRDTKRKKCKVILPSVNGNHEGILNTTIEEYWTVEKKYKTNEFLTRWAGFIAGTPPQISATYSVFPELEGCTFYSVDEIDEKINNGELVTIFDGRRVKCARAVNSLTDTSELKGESFRKIKKVEIMDIIFDDVYREIEDNYIGKYGNSYDNKILLINAIQGYLETLENDSLLAKDSSEVDLDMSGQEAYLKSINYKANDGRSVEDMEIQEIRKADTGDKVFLKATTKILDAIENVELSFLI